MDNKTAKLAKRKLQFLIAIVATTVIGVCAWQIQAQLADWKPAGPIPPFVSARSDFDLSGASIPVADILSGGPRKDGIPALSAPEHIAADDAGYMEPDDQVIGVVFAGDARAYPLKILDFHEIVNDTVGATPVAVTYCPLCDSSVVFDRRQDGATLELGVSGRLYSSNVLMFDRQKSKTESLISQMMAEGVTGPLAKTHLRRLPMEVTSWQSWHERYPQTQVLSLDTGYQRRYDRSVYAGYFDSPDLKFPVSKKDDRLGMKTRVLGVAAGGAVHAYPIEKFLAADIDSQAQTVGGMDFTLVADRAAKSIRVEGASDEVEWVYSYWFAWYAMNPETELWETSP